MVQVATSHSMDFISTLTLHILKLTSKPMQLVFKALSSIEMFYPFVLNSLFHCMDKKLKCCECVLLFRHQIQQSIEEFLINDEDQS